MNYFIVIPAYNESTRILKLLESLAPYKDKLIVVDDGSTDDTASIPRKMGITTLSHMINLGKGAALKTGCEYAFNHNADFVIVMDSDGQHNPKEIDSFIKEIEKGSEIVFGVREFDKEAPLIRKIGNIIASKLVKLIFDISLPDILCGFRAFTKNAYQKIKWSSRGYEVETEMVAKTGLNRLKYSLVTVETIYIDKYKGVSILDSFKILTNLLSWRIIK